MFIHYITTNGYTLLTTVLLTPSPLLTIVLYVNIETKGHSSIVSHTLHIISKKKNFYFSEL